MVVQDGMDTISAAAALLAEWAERVAGRVSDETRQQRKPYTRSRPARRGHKRGPYAKKEGGDAS
jgi:hypothetical protein